jgi:hypothetical protein
MTEEKGQASAYPSWGRPGGSVPRSTNNKEEEEAMTTRVFVVALALGLLFVTVAGAQYPILDMVANKVIQKYQQSTCEQLWEEKGKPKPQQEQEIIQMLRGDAQMRTVFLNKVAGPIANKMFECGMIP